MWPAWGASSVSWRGSTAPPRPHRKLRTSSPCSDAQVFRGVRCEKGCETSVRISGCKGSCTPIRHPAATSLLCRDPWATFSLLWSPQSLTRRRCGHLIVRNLAATHHRGSLHIFVRESGNFDLPHLIRTICAYGSCVLNINVLPQYGRAEKLHNATHHLNI